MKSCRKLLFYWCHHLVFFYKIILFFVWSLQRAQCWSLLLKFYRARSFDFRGCACRLRLIILSLLSSLHHLFPDLLFKLLRRSFQLLQSLVEWLFRISFGARRLSGSVARVLGTANLCPPWPLTNFRKPVSTLLVSTFSLLRVRQRWLDIWLRWFLVVVFGLHCVSLNIFTHVILYFPCGSDWTNSALKSRFGRNTAERSTVSGTLGLLETGTRGTTTILFWSRYH